jgi:hypothetical protein
VERKRLYDVDDFIQDIRTHIIAGTETQSEDGWIATEQLRGLLALADDILEGHAVWKGSERLYSGNLLERVENRPGCGDTRTVVVMIVTEVKLHHIFDLCTPLAHRGRQKPRNKPIDQALLDKIEHRRKQRKMRYGRKKGGSEAELRRAATEWGRELGSGSSSEGDGGSSRDRVHNAVTGRLLGAMLAHDPELCSGLTHRSGVDVLAFLAHFSDETFTQLAFCCRFNSTREFLGMLHRGGDPAANRVLRAKHGVPRARWWRASFGEEDDVGGTGSSFWTGVNAYRGPDVFRGLKSGKKGGKKGRKGASRKGASAAHEAAGPEGYGCKNCALQ